MKVSFNTIRLLPWPLLGGLLALVILAVLPLHGRDKAKETYGAGLSLDLPFAESEVLQAVRQVVQNGTIQGSKEYNKDKDVQGATPAASALFLPAWSGPGSVFFKVREHVVDPHNFKDSNDVGTLAVRYVVVNHGSALTTLRIDAVFVEDFRRRAHASNGSVEFAEYKEVQEQLDKMLAAKKLAADAEKQRQADLVQREAQEEAVRKLAMETSPQALQQRIQELRRAVERKVKNPGADLKSAPFQSATTLKLLPPHAEVVILISTAYWYGVETEDGQHGWISRQQLESLP